MQPVHPQTRFSQASHVVVRPQRSEFLFYNSRTDELHLIPPTGKHVYAMRHLRFGGTQKIAYLHQTLMLPSPDEEVDHRNHNTLDCRRSNMRVCAHAENARNVRKRDSNTSGFKGVHWCTQKMKWKSEIRHADKTYHLGFFASRIDAARAYDRGAAVLHGEFAYPNFKEVSE